jgi:hypothetical protein
MDQNFFLENLGRNSEESDEVGALNMQRQLIG